MRMTAQNRESPQGDGLFSCCKVYRTNRQGADRATRRSERENQEKTATRRPRENDRPSRSELTRGRRSGGVQT